MPTEIPAIASVGRMMIEGKYVVIYWADGSLTVRSWEERWTDAPPLLSLEPEEAQKLALFLTPLVA